MLTELSAQLWSVQDYTSKDFFKTLEEISKIGYTGVEFAGTSLENMEKSFKFIMKR